jgi:hypothetical protein
MQSKFGRVGVLVILALFVWGVLQVFNLQFQGGMRYPAGSTLRADPRGAMILFESLEAMPDIRVRRLLDPLHRMDAEPEQVTLVVLNANPRLVRYKPLAEFVEAGGRVVFQPRRERERTRRREEEEKDGEEETGRVSLVIDLDSEDKLVRVDDSPFPLLRLRRRDSDPQAVAFRTSDDPAGPESVSWGAARVFERMPAAEKADVLYRVEGHPVAIRMTAGEGEWLLLSDNQTFLNQEMFAGPQTEWLLWALDGREDLVFWEYHLGIRTPRGIMTFIRQYQLTPLLGVLILVFVLWVWQGAVPLLSTIPDEAEPERGAQSRLDGLRDLLKRYVPADAILRRCLHEWQADLPRTAARTERLAPLLENAEREAGAPLAKRNRAQILRERFHKIHQHLNPKRNPS